MKRSVAQRWYDDLVSGKYKQCTNRLHKVDGLGTRREIRSGHCCLGVLSDSISRLKATKETGWRWDGKEWLNKGYDIIDSEQLPIAVGESVGLSIDDQEHFWNMNDTEGKSFKQIAAEVKRRYLSE